MPRYPLRWRHNWRDSVSNHQPHGCLLNRLFKRRLKKNIKAPRYWPLCGEFTGSGEFPAQRASCAENVSIWWRHHVPNSSNASISLVPGMKLPSFPCQRTCPNTCWLIHSPTLRKTYCTPSDIYVENVHFDWFNQYLCTGEHFQSDVNSGQRGPGSYGFHQHRKTLQLAVLTKVKNPAPELKSTTPALKSDALQPVVQNLSNVLAPP